MLSLPEICEYPATLKQHNIYSLEWEGDILRILTPTRFTPWNGRKTH
jgi:hypothetical protein